MSIYNRISESALFHCEDFRTTRDEDSSKIRMYASNALEALLVLPQNIDNISLRQTDQNMHFSSPILNSFVAEKKHELIQLLVNATEKTNEAKKSRRDTASRMVTSD